MSDKEHTNTELLNDNESSLDGLANMDANEIKGAKEITGTAFLNRRGFLGSMLTTSAVAGAGLVGLTNQAEAGLQFPEGADGFSLGFGGPSKFGAGGSASGAVNRSEGLLYDCEVEGDLPEDLDGAFYRVGPDPQYPKPEEYEFDIPFDGEGHVTMWRIKDGHVDYRSRYVQTQRWKAQHDARRSLFGMYRNPYTDDPSVAGLSRGTANTQVFYHHGKLLAMKEDSPPVAIDPLTLETTDDYYTFDGGLTGQTFTAHPKIDSQTGEMIAFGYESRGLLSDDVEIISVNTSGKVTWSAWIKVPYACMIHDFAVTQNHIAFLVNPLAVNQQILDAKGPHFAWDSTLSSWIGVIHRGSDGSDIRWFKGPGEMATHTMGAWSDGEKFYWDMDGGESNQFPFFPHLHENWDPMKGIGHVRRVSIDLNQRQENYDFEILYPEVSGGLSRQDDRYHTEPYRYGYLTGNGGWVMMDHQAGSFKTFTQPETSLAEMCFVPRNQSAGEGDGYLIGVATRQAENGRSDVVVIDAQHPEDGPIATIKMPYRVPGQVHGFWVNGWQLPTS